MPTIYMEHPSHGGMHVYTEQDAATHEKIGWVRATLERKPVSVPEPEAEQPFVEARRGPGRPRKDA